MIGIILIKLGLIAQSNPNPDTLLWEGAKPFITTYTPQQYKAHEQNWCFVQDERGIMYVGNTSGVLEFDGINWRLIKLPNGSPAKSLATQNSTIYVGAVRDLGRLQGDSTGRLQYESLLPQLDSTYREFADIWFTFAQGDAIYFISDDYIFRWQNDQFKVWTPKDFFGFAFQINDKIYVDNRGIGLMEIQGDSLVSIPDGDRFLEGGLTTLLPFGNGLLLAANFRYGVFLYDHHKFVPMAQRERNLLENQFIYSGKVLPNGDIALLTSGNGCFILDNSGRVKQWLSQQSGLSSDVLIGGYVDREGSLWMATENGIDQVELSFPVRRYAQSEGLTEVVNKSLYHHQRWYAATFNGLFYLSDFSKDSEKLQYEFISVPGINNQTWDLIEAGPQLLVGNFNGLYQVSKDLELSEMVQDNTNTLYRSTLNPQQVYAGTAQGDLFIIEFVTDHWQIKGSNYTVEGRVMEMKGDLDGSLWISTRYNGVYKLDWPPDNTDYTFDDNPLLTHFDTSDGLPDLSYNAVFKVHSKLYFSTNAGIYQFEPSLKKFIPVGHFTNELASDLEGMESKLTASKDGGIWIAKGSTIDSRVYKYHQNQLTEILAARRFSNHHVSDIREFGDLLLLSGATGLIVYNQSEKRIKSTAVTNLRGVNFGDSLLFGGHWSTRFNSNVVLPFERKTLRFSYALSAFQLPEMHYFQTFLEGFDPEWSQWTTETQRDFTNLPEGNYNFRVRGQDLFGAISEEASYAFTIMPPWYRSWWVYLLYVLAFVGIVGFAVQWRSARLRREKEILENIVQERTRQLEHQAEQLKEMDRVKTRLFANISHEFRTPLTLIKGPVEDFMHGKTKHLPRADAEMIKRNSDRLLRLVNQLLDMSKLETGKLELSPRIGDVHQFLRVWGAAFSSHAMHRTIDYQVNVPDEPLWLSFDKDKLEIIAFNLLSNAFKFTEDGGWIHLDSEYKEGQLYLQVKDNGRGIDPDQLPLIFDRFYQVEADSTYEHEGTGIGLALSKELVNLMNGEIRVDSQPGKGSTFTVVLPLVVAEQPATPVGAEAPSVNDHVVGKGPDQQDLTYDQAIQEAQQMVLVVEDNTDMRHFIRGQLQDSYQVLEAPEGNTGLAKAIDQVPDLIITDLMMPQMDGMALCERLKTDQRTSHIPVIMLTAKAGQEHKLEGLETGADDYLTKPFDSQELQIRIKNLIEQRQRLREHFRRSAYDPRQIKLPSLDQKFMQQVMELLEVEYANSDFSAQQMQDALAMSKTQLYRKLKALTNQSPGEFIRNFRLKKAAQMLSQNHENVTQVAYAVGFNNLSYFAKCFKEFHGQLPSEFVFEHKNN